MFSKKLMLFNLFISILYLGADAFLSEIASKIFLLLALASFLFTLSVIEKLENKENHFLLRASTLLPMLLLIQNFRTVYGFVFNFMLILIILAVFGYSLFKQETIKKGKL